MKLSFDERNRQDYIAISERLRSGITRITDERSESGGYLHAASSTVLAQLAGCSVATIYARQGSTVIDPVASLNSIRAARLEEQRRNQPTRNTRLRVTKEHLRDVSELIDINEKLREEVKLALDEATRWNYLHSELIRKYRALTASNIRLVEKIAVLEAKTRTETSGREKTIDGYTDSPELRGKPGF